MTPLENLLSRLPDAKRSGGGWQTCCPAHVDRAPSLSIGEGEGGRALVHCHAGCSPEAVCSAIGLEISDLMPATDRRATGVVNVNGNAKSPTIVAKPLTTKGKSPPQTFGTAAEAMSELERRHGPRSALWTYHDPVGMEAGMVLRWDLKDGKKDVRPVSRHEDGWRIGGMPSPRPLYALGDISHAPRVYVCEGEKAADAIRSLGLVATTSAHGSKSADKTDWTPLAGKEVALLPDNDSSGRDYADGVTSILAKLTPAATVKRVVLPDLPEKGNAADFAATNADSGEEVLRQEVEALADEAVAENATRPAKEVLRWEPFPVELFPEPAKDLIAAGAKAIGCDPAFVALPLLAIFAAAIGATRSLQIKRGWFATAIVWAAIVGESGTSKTPAYKLAMKLVKERQLLKLKEHAKKMKEYLIERERIERELAEYKKAKAHRSIHRRSQTSRRRCATTLATPRSNRSRRCS